jgi:hypothetical protein
MKSILRLIAVLLPGSSWATGAYATITLPTSQFDVRGRIQEGRFLHHYYMRNGKC